MDKCLTGNDLLKFLLSLTPEERKKSVILIDADLCTSKPAFKIAKAPHNLLWNGEDDPSELKTRNAWINEGYEAEEVDTYTVEVCKGDIILNTSSK